VQKETRQQPIEAKDKYSAILPTVQASIGHQYYRVDQLANTLEWGMARHSGTLPDLLDALSNCNLSYGPDDLKHQSTGLRSSFYQNMEEKVRLHLLTNFVGVSKCPQKEASKQSRSKM
jgi:hypothetical protein